MKRLLAVVILLVVLAFGAGSLTGKLAAQNSTPAQSLSECYTQCGAYKFYWRGDFCFDLVQQQCKASFSLKDVVSMVKSIRTAFLTGKLTEIVDVKTIFTAWFICKPLIDDCVVPQLDACEKTCQTNSVAYAPNLTVGSEFSYFNGLFYNDDNKTLTMRTMNTGLGYAWDIGASLTYGYTENQDGSGLTGGTYLSETIPELLFLGSRQAAPKGVTDTVTDFLIDQSNFSNFLSRFKSDADYEYIPPGWEKTIPFTAPEGKLTRVIFNVDPNQNIMETNEEDNTYILDIDKRPKPAAFEITKIEKLRQGNTLTDYIVRITVKNTGELPGEAKLALFEGTSPEGAAAFENQTRNIGAGDSTTFEKAVTVDVTDGAPNCAKSRRYTAKVTDQNGAATSARFEIPLMAGQISGRVTNTKGKAVAGVTVTSSTGQTATTSDYGFYRITGIPTLGTVTVTFSHPSYTETPTKTAEVTMVESANMFKTCEAEGLNKTGVDAVLRDIPVKLTISLKNSQGQALTGTVLLTGGAGTATYTVEGERVIEEAEVGQFRVTASAPGYITKGVQSVLTPPEQILEIILKRLYGRENDTGLILITPVKLWEKTLPNKLDDIEGAKNGKLLVIYTSKNKPDSGQLHFINPITGDIVKSITVPATKGQQQVGLDVSYDGTTVGYMVNPGTFGLTEAERIIKVFGSGGQELASTTGSDSQAAKMAVSPDGFYVYGNSLMNNSLYKYTRLEMEGVGEKALQSYATSEELEFLRDNTIVASCKANLCVKSLNDQEIRNLGQTKGADRVIDATYDNQTIISRTDKGLAYFGPQPWEKELDRDHAFTSAAITPGGEYVITAYGGAGGKWLTLGVFDKTGKEVTPVGEYKDVRYVEANDRGLFYTSARGGKIAYYQLGKYATEYNPPDQVTEEEQTRTGDLQVYVETEKKFIDLGYTTSWEQLAVGVMYRPNNKLTLKTPWGSLILSAQAVFAKGTGGEPILVWGQAEVEAGTPITMIVIKSKIFEVEAVADKVGRYTLGALSPEDYVLIRNLHTRYEAKSSKGGVLVSVKEGTVEVQLKDSKQMVKEGQTAEVVGEEIKVSTNWMGYSGWIIFIGFVVGIIGGLRFRERIKQWLRKGKR